MSNMEQPKIVVTPEFVMADQEVLIQASGLPRNMDVTIHSSTRSDNGNLFECFAHYITDGKGTIDLGRDSSIGGSFYGLEPMGLFWAMKPSKTNKKLFPRFAKTEMTTPLTVSLKLFKDHLTFDGASNTVLLASVVAKRWYMAPGVKRFPLTVAKNGIHGALFLPRGKGPFPGVITLFGGLPGTMEFKASILASYGFAALAIAFYGVPGLKYYDDPDMWTKTDNIYDLTYFDKVIAFMKSHQDIDTSVGIGVVCLSWGTCIGLSLPSYFPDIRAVIWVNGVTRACAATIDYNGNQCAVQKSMAWDISLDDNNIGTIRTSFDVEPDPFDPSRVNSTFKFYERHDVAYLFIASLNDQSCPSEFYANQAEALLRSVKHPDYQILRYHGAGHLLELPFSPHNYVTFQKGMPFYVDWGGFPYPHNKAQVDSWSKQIQFLRNRLCGKPKL